MLADIVLQFAKQHPWLILLNMLLMLFVPVNEVLLPFLYGKMITNIATPSAKKTLVALIATLAVVQLGFLVRDKINERFVPTLESFMKTAIVDRILEKHNTSFDDLTTGDIIYRMTKIPDIIIYWFQWMNDYIVPYVLVFLTAVIYFLKYDKLIAGAFVVFLAVLFYLFFNTPRFCLDRSKKNDAEFSSLHEHLEDVIHNMPSIYSSNSRDQELKKLKQQGESYGYKFADTASCTRAFKIVMLPLTILFVAAFVLRSKALLSKNAISKSYFVSTFMILTSMLGSVFWIVDIMRYSVFDMGCISNMQEILKMPIVQHRIPPPGEAPKNAIGVRNLTLAYGTKKILDDVSIDFKEGKTTVLVGPVGAGKSTLFKILLGFAMPEKGDAYLFGKWYRDLDIKEVRNKIGYVPQNPVLFNDTVLYNLTYGNEASRYEAVRAIKIAGYDESFLDRRVGKNGMYLSGGQRQLVWCLRVLFKNPPVLLMDEPTASMDEETKKSLMAVLEKMMKNRTVIMITHDPYMVRRADVVQDITVRGGAPYQPM